MAASSSACPWNTPQQVAVVPVSQYLQVRGRADRAAHEEPGLVILR